MAHPDSIKVVVEDAANISVTSSPTLGNVAVTPETPAVISINTNSAQITLAELVGGNPEDGQVIVYDSTTNTFYYDYSSGGSGALLSDLEVSNMDTALGDAIGKTYEQNDSHEGIIRDLLSPNSPVVVDATPNWQKVSSGFKLPAMTLARLDSIDFLFMNPSAIQNAEWTVSMGGTDYFTSSNFPSDYGDTTESRVPFGGSIGPQPHGTVLKLKASSTYDDNGVTKEYSFSRNVYFGRSAFVFGSPLETISNANMSDVLATLSSHGVPSSEDQDGQKVTVMGDSRTQDNQNYTWIAIPSSLQIDSMSEVVAGGGVANRTFSFTRSDTTVTVPIVNGAYSVYLYRSNQKGALSSDSSLMIKLNRS